MKNEYESRDKNIKLAAQKVVKNLKYFIPEKDHSDSKWKFYFRVTKTKWEEVSIGLYEKNYYFYFSGSRISFTYPEGKENKNEFGLDKLLAMLFAEMSLILINPIQYIEFIHKSMPKKFREGIVPRKYVNIYVKNIQRPDKELGLKKTREIVDWLRKNIYSRDFYLKKMTLRIYLEYCKKAYLANAKKLNITGHSTGIQLYKRFADNRHMGLLDVHMDSEADFLKWYESGRFGGHPWEIYRGGNTTHIDLGVHRHETNGWEIFLAAESSSRLVETVHIALSFIENKMPFQFSSAKSIHHKLTQFDNIGIVDDWSSTHRANQGFPSELNVYDCFHLHSLEPKEIKKIISLATWFPVKFSLPKI